MGLVGLNHRAAVDAQQLRLLTMAFEDRCKPLSDREPQQLLYECGQTTIDDWVTSHKAKYGSTSMAPTRKLPSAASIQPAPTYVEVDSAERYSLSPLGSASN